MQFPYSMKESVNISGELFLNQPNLIDEKGNVSSPFEKSNQSIEMKSSEHEWNSSVYFHRISSLRRWRENSIDNNDNSMHLLPLLMVSHSILEYLEKSSFTQMPIEIGWHVFQPRYSLAATALNWSVFIVVRVVVVVVTFFIKKKRETHTKTRRIWSMKFVRTEKFLDQKRKKRRYMYEPNEYGLSRCSIAIGSISTLCSIGCWRRNSGWCGDRRSWLLITILKERIFEKQWNRFPEKKKQRSRPKKMPFAQMSVSLLLPSVREHLFS